MVPKPPGEKTLTKARTMRMEYEHFKINEHQ